MNEDRHKYVTDAISAAYGKQEPPKLTDQEKTLIKVQQIHQQVLAALRPMFDAAKETGQYDEVATAELLQKTFQEAFSSWSKDDLLYALSCWMGINAMNIVNQYMQE